MKFKTLLGIMAQNNDFFNAYLLDENNNYLINKSGNPIKANVNNVDKICNNKKDANKDENHEFVKIRIIRSKIQSDSKISPFTTLNNIYEKFSKQNENFSNVVAKPLLLKVEEKSFFKYDSSIAIDINFNPNENNPEVDNFLKFFTLPSTWFVLNFLDDKDLHYKRIPQNYLKELPSLQEDNFQSKGHIARKIKISTRSVHDDLFFLEKLGVINSVFVEKMKWVKSEYDNDALTCAINKVGIVEVEKQEKEFEEFQKRESFFIFRNSLDL